MKNYLPFPRDLKEIPTIPNLLKDVLENIRETLPPDAFTLVDEYQAKIESDTHKIQCQLDAEAEKGQKTQCSRGKSESDYQSALQANRRANKPRALRITAYANKFKNQNRGITTKNINRSIPLNQNRFVPDYQDINYRLDPGIDKFEQAFDPNNPESTLGNRAVLFDANGRVIKTANKIASDGKEIDESAKLATRIPVRTQEGKRKARSELKSIADKVKKGKGMGEINSVAGLFAAVTGIVIIACLLFVLVPMSFITVALNWLQTITTMIANVRDMTTTYLSLTDAGLSLFGYPNTTNKLKETINGIAYGMFGKDNVEKSKAAFAKGILNLTSLTKVVEKIESMRRGTNSKIDDLALGLGTVSKTLEDSGVIEPGSEAAQALAKIDTFVDAQTKASTDPDLRENIEKLTTQILTQDEAEKELDEEKVARDKIRAQKDKELSNLKKLGDDLRPIANKQIEDARE